MPTIKTKEWLKATLANNNMTQKELANKTGLAVPTIAKIISGERFGSGETWDKINGVFADENPKVSIASTEFIDELKEEISEYGPDYECFVFYTAERGNIIFRDYATQEDLDTKGFPLTELEKMNKLKVTFKEALELFAYQNRV